MNDASYSAFRTIDTAVFPPGSTASLRFDVPQGTGERADAWRISLDNYADQFGAGDEFWLQWRVRMNGTYAAFAFADRNGGLTGYKLAMISAGMQYPNVIEGLPAGWYGFDAKSPGNVTPGSPMPGDNTMAYARIDSQGEIVLRDYTQNPNASVPATMKYPFIYLSKYFDDTMTRGQDGNYGTYHNSGIEGQHVADCQFVNPGGGAGNLYTDYRTCFTFPADQWFTLMLHVKLGPLGTALSSLGATRTGYTGSTLELYGAYAGASSYRLIHRRTNVVFPIDQTTPQGSQGPQKYGQFGFTTFMTQKDATQAHPTAKYWVGQVLVKSGPTPPAVPQ
jgi:hypothetical protein